MFKFTFAHKLTSFDFALYGAHISVMYRKNHKYLSSFKSILLECLMIMPRVFMSQYIVPWPKRYYHLSASQPINTAILGLSSQLVRGKITCILLK